MAKLTAQEKRIHFKTSMIKTFKKPEILTVIQATGVEFKQRGRLWWSRCPLHQEKTPSFCVNAESQRFKCFGCGTSGDVIDFIQKLKGISFKDASRYLNIPGLTTGRRVETNTQEGRRQGLLKAFNSWCDFTTRELCDLVRLGNGIDLLVKTPNALEFPGLGEMYLQKELSEYELSVLASRDIEAKITIFKGTGDED